MPQQIFGDCHGTAQADASYCHKLHKLLEHCMQQIVIIHQQLNALSPTDQHFDQESDQLHDRLNALQERRRFYQTQLINLPGATAPSQQPLKQSILF
ncbi:MAG: hypothetical protein EOO69_11905 [Moraxellaceae bacterium]|nr:MAG: hypothetical protein EOO69_11905 [Moraxellaceae bacterium]